MKPLVQTGKSVSLKKFPSRKAITFMVIQVLTGFAISFIPFGEYQWVREFFEPIDRNFRAFRTMFSKAPDPTAGKVFLLVWWVVFIPWGVVWSGRFTDGFKPVDRVMLQSKLAVLKLLLLSCLGLLMLVYLSAFADYGDTNVKQSAVPSRADIIPAFINGGTFTASIWLALSSFVLVSVITGVILCTRALHQQFFLKGAKK